MTITNALTVNVEDYFQAPAFRQSVSEDDWGIFTSRIEYSVNYLLQILSDHNVKATFFAYEWTIKRFPYLVKSIAKEGHELGLLFHHPIAREVLVKNEFSQKIQSSHQILSSLIGKRVLGVRADAIIFNLVNEWLYDELMLADFDYSSCINASHSRPAQWQLLDNIKVPRTGFQELPVSGHAFIGKQWDIVNSNTLRVRPYESTKRLLHHHLKQKKEPLVAAISCWSIDNEQPDIRGDSLLLQWLHQHNINKMPLLIHQLLSEFHWERMNAVFCDYRGSVTE